MAFQRLSGAVQTLYAELLDQAVLGQAEEVAAADREQRASLCRMLAAGGAAVEPAPTVRLLELLAEVGVFRRGGVLVGTQAFRAYGNMLGVKFEAQALRTQDVDIAQDRAVGIALAQDLGTVDVGGILTGSKLKLLPVPELDPRQPSTSYKARGRDLRVDFLTPLLGRETGKPVLLPSLGVAAHAMRFLDYLIEEPTQAVVVGGAGILVNVPDPARFALHKLLVSGRRPVAEQAKSAKDSKQARALLEILSEDRPDDVQMALAALAGRPGATAVQAALQKISL
jgi:hypothetical protein